MSTSIIEQARREHLLFVCLALWAQRQAKKTAKKIQDIEERYRR